MNNRLEALLGMHEKDPNDSFLMYGIALEYLSAGKFEESEKFFSQLLKSDPKYVPAYMQFARLKENQNDKESAKKLYRQGIKTANEAGDKHAAKEMEEFLDELE